VTRADYMLKAQSAKLEQMQVQIKQAELELKAKEIAVKEYEAETERLQLISPADDKGAQEEIEAQKDAMQLQVLAQIADTLSKTSAALSFLMTKPHEADDMESYPPEAGEMRDGD